MQYHAKLQGRVYIVMLGLHPMRQSEVQLVHTAFSKVTEQPGDTVQ